MVNFKNRILNLFIVLLFTTTLNGETVEMLLEQLSKDLLPKERISVLLELSEMVERNNPKLGYKYALEARLIATQEQDTEEETKSLVQMGETKMYLGEKSESLKILDEAIELAEAFKYDYLIAEVNHIRGLDYYMMGMDELSLTCYHKALEINQRLGIKFQSCRQLNNIALVYRDIKNHDMAIKYLEKSIALAKEIKDKGMLSSNLANIGFVYLDLEEYEKAIPYVDELMNQIDLIEDSISIAISFNIKGLLESGLQQYDDALENAAHSLAIAKEIKFMDGEIHVMQTISRIREAQKKYHEAIRIAKAALQKSDQTDTKRYTEGLLQTLISANKALGDNRKALEYQDRLLIFKDRLYNIEKSKLVDQMDLQYLTREKEMENKKLRVEHDKDKEIIELQKYITILALFIGILFIGLSIALFRSLRIKRINNQELESAIQKRTKELEVKNEELVVSNQELERFAYIASHDLKEPLRNISSFANLICRKTNASENKELQEYANFIVGGSKQMYGLIESILRFSEIKKQTEVELSNVDLNEILAKIQSHLSIQLIEKNASITFENLPVILGDEDQFFILFKNLIENGIKYNESKHPMINIAYKEDQEHLLFSVKDNGIGVKEEYAEVIFEMFKRLHNRAKYSGSGMGLSICKKIVDTFNGEIWIESQLNQGTTFYIQFPKTMRKQKVLRSESESEQLVS